MTKMLSMEDGVLCGNFIFKHAYAALIEKVEENGSD